MGLVLLLATLLWAWGAGGRPALAQSNGFSAPAPGDTVSGIVNIVGTATDPSFLRYELAFLQDANAGAGWIVFAEGSQPVNGGVLTVWDTTVGRSVGAPVFPDGSYQLRLRVVKQDYNYNEYFVAGVSVFNAGPTPTPTGQATRPASLPTVVPVESTPLQPVAVPPTLTPFPTPTPRATRDAPVGPVTDAASAATGDSGLLAQVAAIEFGRFGQAFWSGARIALLLFSLIAVYLLLRGALRWLWRRL